MTLKLYLLARPSFGDGHLDFLKEEGVSWNEQEGRPTPAERLIEFAGRICYMSFGEKQHKKKNSQYIENLIERGHESVLEHAGWTFLLVGVSRAFTHQLVRHRAGFSFSQLSQQYHDESDATFVSPPGVDVSSPAYLAWKDAVEAASRAYREMIAGLEVEGGMSKETVRAIRSAARSVLPNATRTSIVVTANARAIRHFLSVRGAIDGDYEMRSVSKLIYDLILNEAPSLLVDFRSERLKDGSPKIVKIKSGRVGDKP